MKNARNTLRRYVFLPGTLLVLVLSAVAAVDAVTPDDLIAEDGRIEVVDGRHIQTLTRELPMEPGAALTVTNKSGTISVTSWDKDELMIIAEKRLKKRVGGVGWILEKLNIPFKTSEELDSYFEKVHVTVTRDGSNVDVDTVYPSSNPEMNVSVNYEIKVPRETNLEIRNSDGRIEITAVHGAMVSTTSNGKIVLEKLEGSIEARTSNGSITCRSVSGSIDVRTSNGSITIEAPVVLAALDSITCGTSNGSIRVTLNEESAFSLEARTRNGSIHTDFTVDTGAGKKGLKHLSGQVGGGGPTIDLSTTNGSIRLMHE